MHDVLDPDIYLYSGELSGMLEENDQVMEAAQRMGDWLLAYRGYSFRSWAQARLGTHEQALQSMERAQAAASRVGGHIRLMLVEWWKASSLPVRGSA
jgi:hypothetical protein